MSFTYTRNLRLRLSPGITADAKYNLERLDTLLANYVPDSADLLTYKCRGNILFEPASPDLGGSGVDGEIDLSTANSPAKAINVYSKDVKFSTGLSLKDQSTGSEGKYLSFKFLPDSPAAEDQTLSFSLVGTERSLKLGADVSFYGPGKIKLRANTDSDITLPAGGELLTDSSEQTLTNKVISAQNNTITGLTSDNLGPGTPILGTKVEANFGNQNIQTTGAVRLIKGGNLVDIALPAGLSASYSFTLPTSTGINGQVLSTDGTGGLVWTSVLSDGITTDAVEEGTANLYFTNARARNAISATGKVTFDQSTGVIDLSALSSDDLSEGVTNQFYTDVRARQAISGSGKIQYDDGTGEISLSTLTTDDLTEGTNLFYTDERATDAAGNALTDTGSVSFAYAAGAISATVIPGGVDHNSLSNFQANEHIDHSTITVGGAADGGLSLGGTIDSSVSLSVSPANTASKSSPVGADTVLIGDSDSSFGLKSTTISNIIKLVPSYHGYATDWVTSDGTSKTVTHNLGTTDLIVQVVDKADQSTILVDSVVRSDANTVTVGASVAPGGSGWRVLIYRVN